MPATTTQELRQLGIGWEIQTLCTAKGFSTEYLAEKLVLQPGLISRIEEDVVPPTVATLLNISKLFDVTIDLRAKGPINFAGVRHDRDTFSRTWRTRRGHRE